MRIYVLGLQRQWRSDFNSRNDGFSIPVLVCILLCNHQALTLAISGNNQSATVGPVRAASSAFPSTRFAAMVRKQHHHLMCRRVI